MKLVLQIVIISLFLNSCVTNNSTTKDPFYNYIQMEESFDLLVIESIPNSNCKKTKEVEYGVIIGNAVVGDELKMISVLVKCLPKKIDRATVVTIRPIPVPKKSLQYKTMEIVSGNDITNEVAGARFPTIWGEIEP